MSVRSHEYSSCFWRHSRLMAAPLPGYSSSHFRSTEYTSYSVPYASNAIASIMAVSLSPEYPAAAANAAASSIVRRNHRRGKQ